MKVIRCDQGHWYDADAYTKCPHCNPSTEKITSGPDKNGSGTRPASTEEDSFRKAGPAVDNRDPFIDRDVQTTPAEDTEKKGQKTISIFPTNKDEPYQDTQSGPAGNEPAALSPSEPAAEQAADLRKELQGVSNSSVQKTMSYFGKVSQSHGVTEPSRGSQQSMNGAPVVGWLVCIAGPHLGQSFNITAGKNSIGRGPDNDIVLSGDPTVSGSKHAWVTYETKHRNFILQAGDGRYPDLNGEQVIEGKMLKPFDKIEVGDTMLLFVNLCGDTFAWEDYLNKE